MKEIDIEKILDDVYAWSKAQQFKGYNKHDGLNSPILKKALGWSKWTRIIAIQSVMRFPFNIRPLLLVPKTTNPKGIALFVLGLLNRHKLNPEGGYLDEAKQLCELLNTIKSNGSWKGDCWGYPYPWQDLGFYAPPQTPNAVVTAFVCEALLEMYRLTGGAKYLESVGSAIEFFMHDLTVLKDTEEHLCLSYMPMPMSMRVMDVSILLGAVISQYVALTGDNRYARHAKRLTCYVVDQQTDYAAWYYTDPPGDSLIKHDNYHTGFILDALLRYMEASDDWEWKGQYESGLKFYAENLFNKDGSPRWMSDKDYPHDVHGAAQGLISFSFADNTSEYYKGLSEKILGWSIANLYCTEGRFKYRRNLIVHNSFTLLRWCNAWMFRGISQLGVVMNSKKVGKSSK